MKLILVWGNMPVSYAPIMFDSGLQTIKITMPRSIPYTFLIQDQPEVCIYRLLKFRKFFLLTFVLKNLNDFSK